LPLCAAAADCLDRAQVADRGGLHGGLLASMVSEAAMASTSGRTAGTLHTQQDAVSVSCRVKSESAVLRCINSDVLTLEIKIQPVNEKKRKIFNWLAISFVYVQPRKYSFRLCSKCHIDAQQH
jgi:hypothetical protein